MADEATFAPTGLEGAKLIAALEPPGLIGYLSGAPMRRFPDFSGLAARVVLTVSLACLGAAVLWLARAGGDALTAPAAPPATAAREPGPVAARIAVDDGSAEVGPDELFVAGRQLWEEYAPAALREQYAFPSVGELRGFLARLEADLQGDSSEQLAAYERDARRALKLLRRYEGGELLAAWLEPRLDLLKAASQVAATPSARWPEVLPVPPSESAPTPMQPGPDVVRPQYTRRYWDRVVVRRRVSPRAADYIPLLKEIFAAAGVPPELVWIVEVESSMNPEAVSPVGARGLFQFMPMTAARFGLETGVMVDERTDPEKSARAAAAYLRVLHRRFQSWPLALAAYNAGEGRVGRALSAEKATTFDAVAHRLPVETRMYVPKVLATVAAREAVDPEGLPAPGAPGAVRVRVVRDGSGPAAPSAGASPAVEAMGVSSL